MYMLKNKFLLAFVALLLGATLNAQTITIDDARILGALPAGAAYGSGSTVAVPISVNGCMLTNNVYTWKLLNSSNLPTGDSGKVSVFYATFINVSLPASLATGNYKVEVTASTPGTVGATSALFPVTNVASPIVSKANPVFSDLILLDQYYYGICNGLSITSMLMKDSSTAGGTDTLEVIDNYRLPAPTPVKYTPNASGNFNVTFNPTSIGPKFRDAYYTAYIKTINGAIVSTKAYHLINNSWDISTAVLAKAPGTQYSCGGDTVTLRIETDRTQNSHLEQNFPGAIIRVNWNDGFTQNLSQCNILSRNGFLKHFYSQGSCATTGTTNFRITTTVLNPFNIFNGPGLTGTCAAGAKEETEAYVFSRPFARFSMDSVICAMDTLKLKNLSNPGQGPAANGDLSICANLANYRWVINGNNAAPLYQTPLGKVEVKKDTAYMFNATQFGYNTVSLYINNNYQTQSPCIGHDTTLTVCVDTAKVRPNFMLDSAGVLKDSMIGCAPVFCIQNNTASTFCVNNSQFKYKWRVLDANSPAPYYAEIPVTSGDYTYTSGSDTSRQPCISINKTGKYFIELNASATCAMDSSLRMIKYIEANGDAGVNFPVGYDTVAFCDPSIPLYINYDPSAGANAQLAGLTDSVHYTYQASSAGALQYKWTVTPGVAGVDYDTLTSTTVAYPSFRFNTPGLYKVTVLFTNNCQPKTAVQYVAYRRPVAANSGGTNDSICHTTNTFNVTGANTTGGGQVGRIYWTTSGTGTFNPASGTPTTPNIFNPVYTPSAADKAKACDTGFTFILKMNVEGVRPTVCAAVASERKLFIRPCVTVPDAELDGCSGVALNYKITKPGLAGATFKWTIINNFGPVNGGTNNPFGDTILTDVLTGNGYLTYQLAPIKDGCVGNPFFITDTVRPIPAPPSYNLIKPNNATNSMCSGDTAMIEISGGVSSDLFNWTSFNHIGKITGLSTGVNQAGSIKDILINNTAPLLVDTAEYCIRTVTKYGCIGATNCVQVVVTPGPNVANINGGVLKYLCNQSCDTIKHNTPGAAGLGAFTLTYSTTSPSPTVTVLDDSTAVVCGMKPAGLYRFAWKVDPVLAGCVTTKDSLEIQVTDTIPTPYAGMDTAVCDVNGAIQRVININGSLSRPLLPTEYVYYNGNGPSALTWPLYFTNTGTYPVEMRVRNFVCPDKVDTMYVRAFALPLGGSITASPIQSSFCQGSSVTLTANYDTSYGNIGSWEYQIFRPPFTTFQTGIGQNPYTFTATENSGYNAKIISKGWAYGCRDSVYTGGFNVIVDSATIAGTITGSDTIVCTPNTVITLKVNGNRGAVKSWIRSTINQTTGYSPFALGSIISIPVLSTTWYRAVVQNGNCGYDTTAPFRVFIPSGADAAKTGNDTAICNATSILLTGNTPVVGNGSWQMIQGLFNSPLAGTFTFGAPPTGDTTSQNPVLVNIQQYGTYQFVWKIKNLTCDATADTITVVNTAPIANNLIGTTIDTVCSGTKVNITGGVPTGGSGVFTYNWQFSTDGGTTWSVGSIAPYSYSFVATTNVQVRRVIKSDSCYSYSNVINFIVQPTIANNTITPATTAVCYNTLAPAFTGSLPTGGTGTYTYQWDTANNINLSNGLWASANVNAQNYTPGINLTDTFNVRRIITSGKCTDTTVVTTITVYPDAKASFTTNKTIGCAPFPINIDVPLPPALNTTFNWYATTGAGVRTNIDTGAGFPGYTIMLGLDSIKITLVSTSTLGCKPDSMSKWFYTSATPVAAFTVSKDSGCANNTGLNTTTFNFTNTTANQGLFTYVFNYGNGTSTSNPNPSPIDYAPSTTSLDTVYTAVLTATSPSCGSSQFTKTIKIRTKPKPNFSLTPTYQCSGGVINFTNATVGSPNLTYKWIFGDAGNATGSTNADTVSHIYNVASLTTFNPKIIAANECASDSAINSVVIAANTVTLNISVKGGDNFKCLPDTVTFYSNSSGGTDYIWDFGDGIQSTPSANGIDTIVHIYTTPGRFIVKLTGSTTCGSVSKIDSVFAYANPIVTYNINPNTTVCVGDTIRFTNQFNDSTTYNWNFGNGSGGGANPTRTYSSVGTFPIQVTATRQHTLPLGGPKYCTATSGIQTVTIRDTMPAVFTITPIGASCLPYTVTFNNVTPISTLPISTTNWSFGIAGQTSTANPVNYTYNALGQYNVNLTVVNAGGCTYIDSQKVNVAGPTGTWTHDTGYVCGATPINFQINASSTDSIEINYGDATPVVTIPYAGFVNPFQHVYTVGGNYTPSVTLKSVNGCSFFIGSFGTIRVDYVKAKYTINTPTQNCGSTVQTFTNTTTLDQFPAATPVWNINGVTYNVANPSVTFNTSGVYNVRMQVTSVSGCFDSVATTPITIKVNNTPIVNGITRQDVACVGQTIAYTVNTALSEDPITNYNWNFGNGTTGSGTTTQTVYGTAGVYRDTVVVVTNNGCASTPFISAPLLINPTPTVSISPSNDTLICAGTSLTLTASGAVKYKWTPNIFLAPNDSAATVFVNPAILTKYVVTGTNSFGCVSNAASVTVNTIANYTPSIMASPNDTLCKGDSIELRVVGAPVGSTFNWTPINSGLSSQTGISVFAKPNFTTLYKVTITDPAACFPKEDSVWVGVGDTARISLGLDSVYLQGGTQYTLLPAVISGGSNGSWAWTPATDLTCSDCQNPTADIKANICYQVDFTSAYGCKASDDICIIAFCESSQVFISNAFTPDGDGINDRFYVTANGIPKVTSFRVFNRWGQVVFERSGYTPDPLGTKTPNTLTSWDGKFKGVLAPTDVYVYTCEVVCANGTKFTYTGNVALIK